jgi:hypothetical protein
MAIGGSRWIGLFTLVSIVVGCGGGADDGQTPPPDVAGDEPTRSGALAAAPPPPPGTNWVNCATEGGSCATPDTRTVRYGANATYAYKTVTGSIGCNNGVWGDPLFGVIKVCDYAGSAAPPPPQPATGWVNCAAEGGTCAVPGTRSVRYGANGTYFYKTVTGSIGCNNTVWGDPLFGVVKACDYAGDAGPAPTGPALSGLPATPVAVAARVGQTVLRSITLRNTGSANLELAATGNDAASGLSPRSTTIAPSAATELRVALACDRPQSRRVSVSLRTNEAGAPSRALEFDVNCTAPTINYSGPITITSGGTYSGNWASTSASEPAVSIRTREPVIIENCNVRGPGNLIASRFSDSDGFPGVDVTIRNCVGTGTGGLDVARTSGHFFVGVWPRRVVIENNYFASTTGIWVIGDKQAGALSALRMVGNRVLNVTGGHNAVAITEVSNAPGTEVAWNEIINEPFQSYQEDVILTYRLVASAADPARVHSNFVDGAYSRNPRVDPSTGSGINAGDSSDNLTGNRFVYAYDNHVVRPVNVGMFIAAGSDNLLYGNRILRSGLLPDGSRIDFRFTGMYVWDCCYGQVASGAFRNNIARDNLVGYESVDAAGNVTRHPDKLDNCATDAAGRSLCTGNTAPVGRITPAQEDAERGRWLDRVAARGQAMGPR